MNVEVNKLISNAYGKSNVRLTKVVRSVDRHELFEYCVEVQLLGDFEPCYTHGDNSAIVPTDTIKNTVYALARQHTFASPEHFAQLLASHFLEGFSQVQSVEARISVANWTRIPVHGEPHRHAFVNGGTDVRTAFVQSDRRSGTTVKGGVRGLEVIKTTDSAFARFVKDAYTTLQETTDRIFATTIDAEWSYRATEVCYDSAFSIAREAMLHTFATHDSLSVQQTLKAMGDEILRQVNDVWEVSLTMPNQHRLLVNLSPFGLQNPNEIFVATKEPFGLIHGTVRRNEDAHRG